MLSISKISNILNISLFVSVNNFCFFIFPFSLFLFFSIHYLPSQLLIYFSPTPIRMSIDHLPGDGRVDVYDRESSRACPRVEIVCSIKIHAVETMRPLMTTRVFFSISSWVRGEQYKILQKTRDPKLHAPPGRRTRDGCSGLRLIALICASLVNISMIRREILLWTASALRRSCLGNYSTLQCFTFYVDDSVQYNLIRENLQIFNFFF